MYRCASFVVLCGTISWITTAVPKTLAVPETFGQNPPPDMVKFVNKTPKLVPPDSIDCEVTWDLKSINPNYAGFHLYKQNAKGVWEDVQSKGQIGGHNNPGTYSATLTKVAKGTYKVKAIFDNGGKTKVEHEAPQLIVVP